MSQKFKPKSPDRGQRHSAAWGKRLSTLLLILITEVAFAGDGKPVGKFGPDLAPVVVRAHQGKTGTQTVDVIVQYKDAPRSKQEGRVHGLGARLNHRLGMVKAIALTIPASALPALEADPEILSVSFDHPLNGADDYTDAAANVSAAWNAGYTGTGIGIAVIDSGINDSHPDLWDSTQAYSRVVYRQDFTGTAASNASG